MTNKYIEVEMAPTACGIGGSFSVEASFRLDNFKASFYDIGVKISADKICLNYDRKGNILIGID